MPAPTRTNALMDASKLPALMRDVDALFAETARVQALPPKRQRQRGITNQATPTGGTAMSSEDPIKKYWAEQDAKNAHCYSNDLLLSIVKTGGGESALAALKELDRRIAAYEAGKERAEVRAIAAQILGHTAPAAILQPDPRHEPQVCAAFEWDRDASVRKGFTSKANYVAWRAWDLQDRARREPPAPRREIPNHAGILFSQSEDDYRRRRDEATETWGRLDSASQQAWGKQDVFVRAHTRESMRNLAPE